MYLKGGGRLKTCRSAPVMKIVEKKENENLGIILALQVLPFVRYRWEEFVFPFKTQKSD